jgi:hypothetical protein
MHAFAAGDSSGLGLTGLPKLLGGELGALGALLGEEEGDEVMSSIPTGSYIYRVLFSLFFFRNISGSIRNIVNMSGVLPNGRVAGRGFRTRVFSVVRRRSVLLLHALVAGLRGVAVFGTQITCFFKGVQKYK